MRLLHLQQTKQSIIVLFIIYLKTSKSMAKTLENNKIIKNIPTRKNTITRNQLESLLLNNTILMSHQHNFFWQTVIKLIIARFVKAV